MAEQQQQHNTDNNHYENLEKWQILCQRCFTEISGSRPPVYNADNCSCVEVASHTNGGSAETQGIKQEMYYYGDTSAMHHLQPQSYASSSASVPSPEGPEIQAPNISLTNNYLPLTQPLTQQYTSLPFGVSYQMNQFLSGTQDPYATKIVVSTDHSQIVPQDIYDRFQNAPGNSSKSSFKGSSSSGDASFFNWEVDPATGIGAWVDAEGNLYANDEYPLDLSGLTEFYDGTGNK